MAHRLLIDHERRLVVYFVSGEVSAEGVCESFSKLRASPNWQTDFDELVMLDPSCSFHRMDRAAMDRVRAASPYSGYLAGEPGISPCTAFVCPPDSRANVLRLWRALCDADEGFAAEQQVFTNLNAALAWLRPGDKDLHQVLLQDQETTSAA